MHLSLFLAVAVLSTAVLADVGVDQVVSRRQGQVMDQEGKKGGHSVAPVVGYDPTFKLVVGGAYFYNSTNMDFGVDVNTNFRRVYQGHLSFRHAISTSLEYGTKVSLTQGFDPYYGRGGETRSEDFVRLWGIFSINRLYVAYKPTDTFSVGLFGDARLRTEGGVGDGAPPSRQYPDETTFGLGTFVKVDTREKKSSPTDGFVFGVSVTHVPGLLASVKNQQSFTQMEADYIVYKEILKDAIPDVVAAFQLTGGYTFGTPSYAFAYRLGGANRMRGYLDNRFQGKKFYMQQTELRFPIWKLLGGTATVSFGDATDGNFTNPKLAYGFGVTLGLPPDWVNKIRIDFGWGRDQNGIFANFGYVF